jgi:hypothetical protein
MPVAPVTTLELHGQPGWVAALTPLPVDGMTVAASTTLLAESRSGHRGGWLPWVLLVTGSVASLAANVAVAEPAIPGGRSSFCRRVRHACPRDVRPGRPGWRHGDW